MKPRNGKTHRRAEQLAGAEEAVWMAVDLHGKRVGPIRSATEIEARDAAAVLYQVEPNEIRMERIR